MALGGAGLLLGLRFGLLFRNGPREHLWANEAEQRAVEEGTSPATPGRLVRARLSGANAWTVSALLLYAFASTFADQLYVFWVPQFLDCTRSLAIEEEGKRAP